jgi:hypothetical protein
MNGKEKFLARLRQAEQSTGQAGVQTQADFVGCLTNLFKDIVLAIEGMINSQNNSLISVVGAQEGLDPREVEL